jgi:hypothetical protein
VHLVAWKVIIFFGLFFILLVDFSLNIDELVSPLLAPTLARGLTLLSISILMASARATYSHLHVVVFVIFVFLLLIIFLVLLLAGLFLILALLIGILVYSRGS